LFNGHVAEGNPTFFRIKHPHIVHRFPLNAGHCWHVSHLSCATGNGTERPVAISIAAAAKSFIVLVETGTPPTRGGVRGSRPITLTR
jgi:hypothetical protein